MRSFPAPASVADRSRTTAADGPHAPSRRRWREPLRAVRRAVLARRRVLAALLTAIAVVAGLRAATAPAAPTRPLLVAAHDLPAGTELTAADLVRVEQVPGTQPAGLAPDPVGRVLAAPLRRGEAVTDVRLVGPALAPEGLTAVPVRLPDAEMAGLLRVGDRIDLIATDPQGAEPRVVAPGVQVVALPGDGSATDAGGQTGSGLGTTGRVVVVAAPDVLVAGLADAAVRTFLTWAWAR